MSLILKSKYIVLFSTLLFINVTAQSNLIDSVLYVFPNKSKLCRVSGKYGVLTRKEDAQKDFHNLKWDKISESKYFPDMYLVDSSVYKGLIRKIDGKIITLPKWQFIDTFSHNVAIVVRVLENTKNIQMAMIDKNGNEIMPPTCLIKKLKNSNYLVSNEANGHLYVLDKTGKILREHLGYKAITYQNQRSTTDFMGFENQSFLTEDNNRTLWLLNADGSKDSLNYYIYSNNHSHNQSFPYILLQKKLADNEPYQSNQANRTMLIHLKTGQKYLVDRLDYNGSNKATFLKDRLTGIIADTGIALPNRYFGIRELKDGRFAAIDRDTNMILFSSNLDSLVSVSKVKDLRTISKGIYKIKKLSELYGLIDDAGKTILDYNYFDIDEYFDSILVLRDSENKSGVMTIDKKIIIPLEHSQEIRPLRLNGEVYFKIIKDSKIAIFDGKGQNITGFRFDNLQSHTDETFFFQESSKWGIVSLSGKVIVPAKWLEVSQTMECYPNLVFKVKTKTEFEEIATYVGENGVEVKSKSPCNDMRLVKTGAGQTVEFRN